MDDIINLAKKGYSAYQGSQSDVSKTGGAEYNSPHHSAQDGKERHSSPEIDHEEAIQAAKQHGSGDTDLFSSALNFLGANKDKHADPLNDEEVTKAHERVYNKGDTSGLSPHSIGSAAALEVLKQAMSGSKSSSDSKKEVGNTPTEMISLAMAEATKIFDKTGGKGEKQDAVNGAAMTVMKLLVQSKLGGSPIAGGSNSGGLAGLLSLANKF